MKKLAILLLLAVSPLYATTYYANGLTSQNINYTTSGAGWFATQGASCVATGTQVNIGSLANGDVLNANGCTGIAVNVDAGAATGASAGVCGTVTVTVTLETDTSAGGTFTYATATNIVMHSNFTATKTVALAITGSSGGGTICGAIQGGSSSGAYGVTDGHTVVTVYDVGNITGGTSGTGYGYYLTGSGPLNIAGTVTVGSTSTGAGGLNVTGAGAVTMTGSCVGGNSSPNTSCYSSGGAITLTGSVINGLKAAGFGGAAYFSRTTTNYTLSPANSSYTLGVNNSNASLTVYDPGASNVRNGLAYGPNTGTLVAGTNGYACGGK